MLNVAEWLFSGVLVLMIISFVVGYVLGYRRSPPQREEIRRTANHLRYRYSRDGDTSQCK